MKFYFVAKREINTYIFIYLYLLLSNIMVEYNRGRGMPPGC